MANARYATIANHLRRLAAAKVAREEADAELLRQFISRNDQEAFAAIVGRHGPLVLRVCRHLLRHEQDAEDAFQATFLILARKAASIRNSKSLTSWLHGVAHRTAMNAKRSEGRRRAHEKKLKADTQHKPDRNLVRHEIHEIVEEEIHNLPERLRTPFLLCHVEGQGRTEAARRLGLKVGTIWSRLSQARKRLQIRLAKRGVTIATALGAIALCRDGAKASISHDLIEATARAASEYVAFGTASAVANTERVVTLVNEGMKEMKMLTVRFALVVLVSASLLAVAGVVAIAQSSQTTGNSRSSQAVRGAAGNQRQRSDLEKRLAKLEDQVTQLSKQLKDLRKQPRAKPPHPAGKTQINIFSLRHAKAPIMANVLNDVLGEKDKASIRIAFDERTNSLLVNGSQEQLQIIQAVIERLDRE